MPITTNETQYYVLEEAAAELQIGVATLYRWMKSGRLRSDRILGRTLIPSAEVARLSQKKGLVS